jgi:hypothetical protein
MVEAGGGELLGGIDNTQLIDFYRSLKRPKLENCGLLERIWNVAFSRYQEKKTCPRF